MANRLPIQIRGAKRANRLTAPKQKEKFKQYW